MTAESGQDIGKAKIYAILGHYLLDRDQNWRRPSDEGPGDWMPVYQGKLILGHLAYPLCRGAGQLLKYLGPEIYEAEVDGEVIEGEDLIHARRVRLVAKTAWDERSARRFAIDCAERVLPVFEKVNPQDDRPRRGLEAARAYVGGKIDRAALETAIEGVGAAQVDARYENEDLLWGSTFEEQQLDAEAGSPKSVAYWAVKAARSAVDWGELTPRWTTADSAGCAARNAVTVFVIVHDFAAAESERKWQARRLLECL